MEIAFVGEAKTLDQRNLAFMCEALNVQMREHYAPKWLEEPWPVKAYSDLKGLPIGSFWPIAIMSDIGAPNAAGYHTWEAGLSYGRVQWDGELNNTSVTASHEALELRGDPRCNRWIDIGSGYQAALELCDPCEGDSYDIEVELFGEKRSVKVSDFVLPSYFVKGAPRPYTYLDTIDSTIHERGLSRNGGGYLLLRDSKGSVIDYWGRTWYGARRRAPATWRKWGDPLSRVSKRKVGAQGGVVNFTRKVSPPIP